MSTPSIATVITDAGFSLLRAAPGHKLIYTRAVCGSGHVEKTQLAALTEVMDYVMDLSIVEFGPTESAATLRLQLDNSKAPKEFQLYQIGIYAKLLDGEHELIGETLIQIMQYEEPDIVRAVPHVSEFVVNVLLGQAETVEGIIDMAAYVSIRQFSSRTVNGKPLSADVILTSEDIKVSDSDPTTVKTALSNKVSHTTVWDETAKDLHEDIQGLIAVNPEESGYGSVNAPEHVGWGMCLSFQYDYVRTLLLMDHRGVWVQHYDGSKWNDWRQIATATPPQVYDLPLAEGWSGIAKYYKSQENICVVELDILKSSTIESAEVLATLPEGFRPSYHRMQPVITYSPHGSTTIGVDTTGSISFGDVSGQETVRHIYASIVFIAQ